MRPSLCLFIFAVLFCLSSGFALAAGAWKPIGPEGGKILPDPSFGSDGGSRPPQLLGVPAGGLHQVVDRLLVVPALFRQLKCECPQADRSLGVPDHFG